MAARKKIIRCAVVGASGYAGLETLRILSTHPSARVVFASSNKNAGKPVREVFPHLEEISPGLCYSRHEDAASFKDCEAFILALPHGKSYDLIQALLERGKVVDISADFRLADPDAYDRWYDYTHPDTALLEKAVYGLTEVYRKDIKKARLLANPGCYPTSVALALHPLAEAKQYVRGPIIIDSKSGYSGAGRSLKPHLLFSEGFGEFLPYAVTGHRHTSEMIQEARRAFGWDVPVTFTPHLLPVSRGILSTIYIPLQGDAHLDRIRAMYDSFYEKDKFVRLVAPGEMPSVKKVIGTNLCLINVFMDEELNMLKIVSAIDNLVKGAAGQAVQNLNLMFGLPEDAGLETRPLTP